RRLRVVAQEGPWADLVREVAPSNLDVSIVTVPRPDVQRVLEHAVAEGLAPDLAVFDTVSVPEFAASGFLYPLEELDDKWVRLEHETDFLEPLVAANRHGGQTYGVVVYATVSGLWYRREVLDELGLGPPRTWAHLRLAARAIAARGLRHPIVMTGGPRGG